jgi:magnesium-transporting ATPase (P-type)
VAKQSEPFDDPDIPLGDRLNMVYAGSQITKGRARAVVIATGMNTELGKIAQAIERKVKPTETGWKAKWYKVQVALGVKGTTPLQMKYAQPVSYPSGLLTIFFQAQQAGISLVVHCYSTGHHRRCFHRFH